jgi:DNA repair protein RadC
MIAVRASASMAGGVRRASALPVPSFRYANLASSATLIGVGMVDSVKTKETSMSAYACRANIALKPLSLREERAIHRVSGLIERRARAAREQFSDADIAAAFFRLRLAALEHEVFEVAFLDNQHRLIACETMFRGTVDATQVHPREVMRRALQLNAVAMVIAHNHPSGNPKPSAEDIQITGRLCAAAGLLDMRIIDHVLIAGERAVSFLQRGLL